MNTSVAILGVGITKIEKAKKKQKLDEMVFEAASSALLDAGLDRGQLDSVVISGCDELDGRCISSMLLAMPAGAYLKDEIKVTDEGCYGVILAALRLMTGQFNLSMVVGWCKTSEAPVSNIMNMRWDPFYHRGFGMNHVAANALMASAYLGRYGISTDVPAMIVVKNRGNGRKNKLAQLRQSVTLAQIRSSRIVSWPLRELDCAPESDGACALILASRRKAKELKSDPVWITGLGWATDSYYLGERDLAESSSTHIAASRAYSMTKIKNPLRALDVAEISDFTSYHELIACEGLGFCGPGKAEDIVRDGSTQIGGMLPVNPSGGILSGNPMMTSGLFRICEAYLQAAGKAGDHQVPGVRKALAQGSTGFCAQGNAVFILQS
ncbi:MAG: thiolase family protein [Deltaproteobacteria bacterium]|nr:thiolase family protein [Deltaproteobacteria bacterium]